MKKQLTISLLGLMILCQSCATIFSGINCKVKVNSGQPVGAKVYMNGNYIGTAPCEMTLSKNGLKNGGTKVLIKADGYKDQEVTLTRKVKVAGLIGDILCGLFPLIVDFADGAIYKAAPDKINYNLDKSLTSSNDSLIQGQCLNYDIQVKEKGNSLLIDIH
jgi:hypothetical protein